MRILMLADVHEIAEQINDRIRKLTDDTGVETPALQPDAVI